MTQIPPRPRNRNDFRIAVICALPLEAEMVQSVFDKDWDDIDFGQAEGDQNAYTTGTIGQHNIVLAYMPGMGSANAAAVAAGLRSSYYKLEIAFVVGICGVTPKHPETQEEIILGDCIVGTTIIQYDFGRRYPGLFIRKPSLEDTLERATPTVRALVSKLQTAPSLKRLSSKLGRHLKVLQQNIRQAEYPGCHEDLLFEGSYLHTHHDTVGVCDDCIEDSGICTKSCGKLRCETTKLVKRDRLSKSEDTQSAKQPRLHFGRYGSANTVLKSGIDREQLTRDEKIVAFEMEGAGVLDSLPTILVKSACDYADSHKNKKWQRYAAATAAAGLKSILEVWKTTDMIHEQGCMTQVAFNVPDHAVAHFVPRNAILDELDDWLLGNIQQERFVLRGMGGAGKSQLALECCKRAISSGQYPIVLWVDASSTFSVHQSFKIILGSLEGPDAVSVDAKENVHRVAGILRQRRSRWLVVFDNFDSPRDFRDDPITGYIPDAKHGKILFTSRDADSERLGRTIHVSGMTEEESLSLLLRRRPLNSTEREFGLQIAAEVGHLALVLDQAEAYVRAHNLTLQEFVTHFKQRKKKILQEIPQHWEYRRSEKDTERDLLLSAFTTWELSFEQISGSAQTKQHKGHFLTLCAFFAPSSISKKYFEKYCEDVDKEWTVIFKNGTSWDGYLFDDLVAECRRLSLLQTEVDSQHQATSISFHPLIRDWLKLRKTVHEEQEIAQEFTDILTCFISIFDFDTIPWEAKQALFANINSCLDENAGFRNAYFHSKSNLAYPRYSAESFVKVLFLGGLYSEAEELNEQLLANCRDNLGYKHYDTLRTMGLLATVYLHKGRYDDAEELFKKVLASNTLNPNDQTTLQSTHDLAFVYLKKGRIDDAEDLYVKVLAVYKEELGPDDPSTLSVMDNLAFVYQDQGRLDEAERLHKHVLASMTGLDPQHRETMWTMGNLAVVFTKKGMYDEAEDLFRQVLAGVEVKLGAQHPDTLWFMGSLASVYTLKGRYDDAEDLHKRVLASRQEKLGFKHPDTLQTLHNLALVYCKTERYGDGERLLDQALAGMEEKLGSKHPETLRTLHALAAVYRYTGRYDDAERLLDQALAGTEEKLGSKHPETLQTLHHLALVYRNTGRYDDAERLLNQALAGRQEKLGPNHSDTLQSAEELALLRFRKESQSSPILPQNAVQSASVSENNPQKKHERRVSRLFRRLML